MSTEQCEPWPLISECLPSGWSATEDEWTEQQRAAVEVASALLRRFTAGQYGLCRIKVRPCREPGGPRPGGTAGSVAGPWVTPMLFDGRLLNISCRCRSITCGCGDIPEISLGTNVHSIVEVKVDGAVVPNTAYRVDSKRLLVRTDGQPWPSCQQLGLADTEIGTWSVTYRRGNEPDYAGKLAVTTLAVEIYRACQGDKKCGLPTRVTSVVREGVTYDLLDDLSVFDRGRTGLPRVDMWLAAVNRYNVRSALRAFSPDTIRTRETTWPVTALVPDPDPEPPTSDAAHYTHVQTVPSTLWTVVHNLGFNPGGVRVEDGAGIQTVGEVSYVDTTTLTIAFNTPLSGVAYLS